MPKHSEEVAPGIWMDEIDDGHFMMVEKNGKASVLIHTTPKVRESFSVRESGDIGQEIIGPDGRVFAWTTDEVKAALICKLLTLHKKVADKKASA